MAVGELKPDEGRRSLREVYDKEGDFKDMSSNDDAETSS